MLSEQIGVIVQVLLMGLGTIRLFEVLRAGYRSLYRRQIRERRVRSESPGVSIVRARVS